MLGELVRHDDGDEIRFIRHLDHDVEAVWAAVTEHDHLAAWFPQALRGEWAVGAALVFEADEPAGFSFGGKVLAVDRPRLLEFTWGTDRLRFELSPDGAGCTLRFGDSVDELGKAARDGTGWHVCLDRLEHELARTSPPWTTSERWRALHPDYVEAFGPEASTLGPPPASPLVDDDGA